MSIFVDTGIWVGFFNLDDEQAARSSEIIEEIQKGEYGVAWTSTFVLDELYTFLERKTNDAHLAIEAIKVVLGEFTPLKPFAKLYPISIENCVQTLTLAEKYSDKRMSFTDLTSILICQKLKISYIASYDSHFKGLISIIR
ncbi:MAG: type II toxin-antitoxin system VapC family toxin [Candidatus Hodarchaeales archaeon]